ncbi:MAG: porin family protein [Proteobacteria bacterium]|nr:porin family protein [Pseudomonadota bacterium]
MSMRTLIARGAVVLSFLFGTSAAIAGDIDGVTIDSGKWSGAYIGVNAGYGWSDAGSAYDFGPANDLLVNGVGLASNQSNHLDGYVVGGQVGFQRQFGNWVLGVEGTLDSTGMDDKTTSDWSFDTITCPFGCFGVAGDGTQSLDARIDNLFMVSGKVGYTFDDWMAYVRGGYAGANITAHSNISGDVTGCVFVCGTAPVSTSSSDTKRHDGWSIGGGIERMILPNLTVGVEYNYIDLGAETYSFDGPLTFGSGKGALSIPGSYSARIDPDAIQTVTFRLNFLLNGPAYAEAAPLK